MRLWLEPEATGNEEARTMRKGTLTEIRPRHPHSAAEAPDLTELTGNYLSLTTFRRDGSAVATPVWFVHDFDRLLVQTDGSSGKVQRLQRNPHAIVAPCTARGRVTG